jgi:methylenetetrahydrofolate dehydrogenase (NADP+)/methenyltetrahydrofolate cyclohydrolase
MTAKILDGQVLADIVKLQVAEGAASLAVKPGLGTILVGHDPASESYVGAKIRDCADVGFNSIHAHLDADVDQETLEATIQQFNDDPAVHAYIVQLPLPKQLNEERALLAIDPNKDADGLHPVARFRAPQPLSKRCSSTTAFLSKVAMSSLSVVDSRLAARWRC